jgi:hypothetical protein
MAENLVLQLNEFSRLYLCKHFTNLGEDERNYLISIFSHREIENNLNQIGSKFLIEFANGPLDLITKLTLLRPQKVFSQNNGRKVLIYFFDQQIGTASILHRNDIPTAKLKEVTKTKRGESLVWTWKTTTIFFTNQLVLIIENNKVITCFPGIYAPPLPSNKLIPLALQESIDFWDNYVFLVYE